MSSSSAGLPSDGTVASVAVQELPSDAETSVPEIGPGGRCQRTLSLCSRYPRLLSFVLLVICVCAASTGTTWFALQLGDGPIMQAAWRMQLTVLLQLPMMIYELRSMSPEVRSRWLSATVWLTIPCGLFALGPHFALCAAAVEYTSLAHAILASNCPPLFLISFVVSKYLLAKLLWCSHKSPAALDAAAGERRHLLDQGASKTSSATDTVIVADAAAASTGKPDRNSSKLRRLSGIASSSSASVNAWLSSTFPASSLPPTMLEVIGAALSFAGISIVVAGSEAAATGSVTEGNVTVEGDLYGVAASALFAAYLLVAGRLRKWMPLFSWLCPLHIAAAVSTTVMGVIAEPDTVAEYGVFAWMYNKDVLAYALGAAWFAGMMGHGIANYVMKTLSPLIVAVAMLGQPLVGSCIGYAIGIQGVPSTLTFVAAPMIIAGAFLTTVGNRERGLSLRDIIVCRLNKR